MKRDNVLINLGLVFSLLFCMAFACNDGDKQDGAKTDNPQSGSKTSETRPPTEREVKDTFVRVFGSPEVKFENIQITSTVKSYTSNLGVYVHGYPVKITSVIMGGYGVKNGTRTSGVYYFYQDDFGDWQLFSGDSSTSTEF